ncbi:MAG: hypothetical protein APG12_00858 [Candidatus Methanofastidiosum methylothiophilum]|uniref:Uncharacterized protein n=1 Tax=Candidatus Methanofastidiosum methylothiophilum TaxID=1705564 RepID=A0A150IZA5_9EURY|nr:MAG: hypothetical protein APG10_01693 [Candidatus Methanofastidiosum methylthiophilus]KYC46963.1 MAG: hypothetical protein APG11_01558 [Candidatus Methanofastidiosum methylthiophilus]KYC50330.1 MAG: hypothetical protein APG12_00858 [Candidatus Methanofastidiosum methylthiophilus]
MELTPIQTFVIALLFRISVPILLFVVVLYFYKKKGNNKKK